MCMYTWSPACQKINSFIHSYKTICIERCACKPMHECINKSIQVHMSVYKNSVHIYKNMDGYTNPYLNINTSTCWLSIGYTYTYT